MEVAAQARTGKGRPPDVALRWGMGEIMKEFFGRIDPSKVRERLAAALQETSAGTVTEEAQ